MPPVQISMKMYSGKVVDINAFTLKLEVKSTNILAAHALSGCDTVSYPFGKGKVSAINLLQKTDCDISSFSDPAASEDSWLKAGLDFLIRLYGGKLPSTFNSLRFALFSSRQDTPKIKSLPPTDTSAIQHVKRARHQVMIWRAADRAYPPSTDLSKFGWRIVDDIPVPDYSQSSVAPPAVLKLVACGCKSDAPCSRGNCSCRLASLSCTTYCHCKAEEKCVNTNSMHHNTTSADMDDRDVENNDGE